jgi:hypothetical protein
VTENDAPHSGSRWEPHAGDATHPPSDLIARPVDTLPGIDTASEGAVAGRRTGWARRGVLAGAGAGILVLGGLGGFAAGHAFAGSGGDTPAGVPSGIPGQNGTGELPGPDDGDGHVGPHDGFGDRFDGVPPGGSAPAAPSAGTAGGNA